MESNIKELEKLNTELTKLELEFVRCVVEILGAEYANGIRALMLGNLEGGNGIGAGSLLKTLQDRPLAAILKTTPFFSSSTTRKKRLFFTSFPGDVSASQVSDLREEVTAIIRSSQPNDEALLVLQSGGGTVTGLRSGRGAVEAVEG